MCGALAGRRLAGIAVANWGVDMIRAGMPPRIGRYIVGWQQMHLDIGRSGSCWPPRWSRDSGRPCARMAVLAAQPHREFARWRPRFVERPLAAAAARRSGGR